MIYYIEGQVKQKGDNYLVIDSGSLGYQIFVNDFLLNKAKLNELIKIFTHFHVYEETLQLYGFETEEELSFFKKLNNIPNIGPKSANNILSAIKLSDLKRAIINEDMEALNKVSGIGKKTAERIIIELKDKINDVTSSTATGKDDSDVIDGLISLGYTLKDSRVAIKKIPESVKGANERLKQALKILSGK
ncbi:MAG: Holliday junction branch migration protein RuvA [Patescibacteria group bacterium]|nr:Holliday junction branch migration protein RuvA [Patescibacteria group bacterium]MDD5121206.1 Holliday junction branch migration protein RuvA [Patescibacteria group bacterium]MDD5221765.1 Holliday junction branch migration protein RuvA [Patescibacteria group bacterium]MDD5395875.1 Holliday junction branch migration protein RuvA [Patescibacteria group bacterium]